MRINVEKELLAALVRGGAMARECALCYAPSCAETSRAGKALAAVDKYAAVVEAAGKLLAESEKMEEGEDDKAQ